MYADLTKKAKQEERIQNMILGRDNKEKKVGAVVVLVRAVNFNRGCDDATVYPSTVIQKL